MSDISSKLTGFLGEAGSGALGHALVGLFILIVGLIIVKIITGFFGRILSNVSFLKQTNTDGSITDLTTPITSLIKGLLTIFVLMAVLQHFGMTDVLEPLKEMLNEFMDAIPNVIGAGVIGYAGWIIAKIVSQLVGMALTKVDDQIAEKTGNSDIKISAFGSAFIFGGILLPIIVSALGVLNIPAISEPASAMIQNLMSAVPNIIGAAIILLVAYYVSKFVVFMLTGLLDGMGIDSMPQKLGVQGMFSQSFTPTKLIGGTIMFFSMMAASTAAVNVLGIDIISTIFAKVLQFGGGILVGGVILIIGNFLSTMAHKKLSAAGNPGVANIARIAIIGLVLAMGLKAMGLADNIVNMAFGFTLGSVAVALALAFGLGGRDAARTITNHLAKKIISK
ncbi:MAG: mechanosensitive ion channel [Methylococcaceae bacterium]|nr:mechanosensitive ion channel [Methylococcaceae bacterium]